MCAIVFLPLLAWGLMIAAANAISWAGIPRPSRGVIDDRQCLSCGYSLEGLPGNAACPECGTRERYSAFMARRTAPPEVPLRAALVALAGVLPAAYPCFFLGSRGGEVLPVIVFVLIVHVFMSASATTLIAIRRDPRLTRTFMIMPAAVQFLVGAFFVVTWVRGGSYRDDAPVVAAGATGLGLAVSMVVYFLMAVTTYLSLGVLGPSRPDADDQGTP
ncbi:MAG TPA: hypothetical protein VD997_10410 [Phycisphaerales bacterium]|nr:hypothetical protein [Phycisphaerales bacterium]